MDEKIWLKVNDETTGEDLFNFIIEEMSFKEVMELYKLLDSTVKGLYGTMDKE